MATQWISPTWRMPKNSNQSKVDNYSLSFNGTDEYIDLTQHDLGTVNTISFWLKRSNTAAVGETIFGEPSNTFDQLVYIDWSANLFYYKDPANNKSIWNISASNDTDWHNYTVTRNGTATILYVDGGALSLDGSSGTLSGNTMFRYLGVNYNTNTQWFEGDIGQIVTYQETLTASQASALYASGTPVNPMALTPLPVAYYPLGGGSTGSASTLTVPNDAVPSATVFNFVESSTQYIDIGTNNSVLMPTDELSISLWVKFSAAAIGNYRGLFSANSAGGNDGYLIWKSNTNLLQFLIRESGVWRTASFSPAVVQDVWYHVVGTWDGTDVKIYVDNVVGGTTATASSITYNASTVNRIGDYATYEMDGDMANVQFWNKGLSAANVTTLYNNGVPLYTGTQPETANLKGWWKLNVDNSTWDGSDWIIGEAQATYSSALSFDGSGQKLTFASRSPITTNFTVCFWMRAPNANDNDTIIGDTGTAGGLLYGVAVGAGGLLKIYADGWNGLTTTDVTSDDWYFIALTYDGTDLKSYVNGVLEVTLNNPTFSNRSTSAHSFNAIGIRSVGGSSFGYNGELSNLSYFDTHLSLSGAESITSLYNNGTPVDVSSYSNLVGWWKLDNTSSGLTDNAGSNNLTNTGTTVTDIQVSTLNGISDNMTTANLVTSDLTRSIPYSSYSMQFDATNDYIIVPANVLTNFTTSVWLNRDGNGNYDGILGQDTTSAKGGILRYVALNDDDIYVFIGAWTTVATSLPLNTWVHFCLTYDSTADELKSYINGVVDTTVASPNFSGASTDAHSFTRIGLRNGTDATSFPGKLSNVSLFNSALSADQILTIYNGGVPNDISSLSPVSWWSLSGDSYYNGTDWICPDLGSAGNNGTSANMSGTEIIGDGPGSTANGVATSMDIPANLKSNAPNSSSNALSFNMTAIDRVTSVPG